MDLGVAVAGGGVVPPVELVARWALQDAAEVAVLGEPVAGGDPADRARVVAEGLDDFALVDLIVGLEREASVVRARQLAVVEVLARRGSMNPGWPVRVSAPCVAGEEVAAALGTSRQAGRDLVATARLFAGPLVPTGSALAAGDLDWVKARIVAGALGDVPVAVAVDVQARVLPGAGRRTPGQLRTDLAKALIVVDPVDAEQRAVRATGTRRVCHPKVLADGMAGIWAVLPAPAAAAIDTALGAAARTARTAGDPRTTDQVRADTFTTALIGDGSIPVTGDPATGRPAGLAAGLAAGVRVEVTVSLASLLGDSDEPGQLGGYGPITAQAARRLATAGTWRRLVTDPVTGTVLDVGTTRYHPPADLADLVRARDGRCQSPICSIPAHQCDLDHRDPFHPDGTGGATSAANLGALCRRDHLLKTHAHWTLTTTNPQPGTDPANGTDPATGTNSAAATDPGDAGWSWWTTPTGHIYPYRPDPPPGHEPPLTWDHDPPF